MARGKHLKKVKKSYKVLIFILLIIIIALVLAMIFIFGTNNYDKHNKYRQSKYNAR